MSYGDSLLNFSKNCQTFPKWESFYFTRNVFISSSCLKNSFVEYKILAWHSYPLSTLIMLSTAFWASVFLMGKWAINLISFPLYIMNNFFLAFRSFFVFRYQDFYYEISWCGSLCTFSEFVDLLRCAG